MSKSSSTFGLDTSVVLRLLVGQPIEQAERALRFVETQAGANRPCQVCDLVVAEAYFALHAHYQVPKSEALSALLDLLTSGQVESTEQALRSLRSALAASSKPGFVDRLIHEHYLPARLVTFERAATRLPMAQLLE